jgi:hypothetical protein
MKTELNMKIGYKKWIPCLALVCVLATGCEEELIEANKNPDVLNEIAPENQFLAATISIHSQDFEAYYDFYRRIMPWMQYVTPLNGNGINFTDNVENFSNRYGRLYTGIGDALTDVEKLVTKLPEEEQPRYVYMINISRILKAYYTFYVSDIYGSVAYAQAWQARYGGTLTPVYDSQQTLFNTLDADVKAAIAVLKTAQPEPQISLGNYDQYFRNDTKGWIRAANALRLKIATRLVKRDASKAGQIASEVLAEGADNLMANNDQGWVFKSTAAFVSGGNWNPDGLYSTQPIVDFMWDKSDPRLDAFFSPNGYSQATIDVLIDEGELEAGTVEEARRYFGSFTSPDDAIDPDNQKYYTARTATIDGTDTRVDTLSLIQRRLFQPSFDEGNGTGTGLVNLPVITYADFCFMRAELAARGVTSEDAEQQYINGVVASIRWYDKIATEAALGNYTPVTQTEIDNYLAKPGIAFDDTKALDQISSQAYLNFFRQPAEGWAVWKRTGFPNTTSVLALTDMKSSGSSLPIPRRAPLQLLNETSLNYENQKAAYDEMAQEAGFGAGPTDAFGRVWWDMQ